MQMDPHPSISDYRRRFQRNVHVDQKILVFSERHLVIHAETCMFITMTQAYRHTRTARFLSQSGLDASNSANRCDVSDVGHHAESISSNQISHHLLRAICKQKHESKLAHTQPHLIIKG